MSRLSGILLLILCVVIFISGCSDDDTVASLPTTDPPPDPPDPAEVLKSALEEMDSESLASVLHDDFRFLLQADTIAEFGLPLDYFDRTAVQDIHANIFSGEPAGPPTDPEAGISSITFVTFERQGVWTAAPGNDPNFPGALYATYNIKLEFARPGSHTLIVRGFVQFYVVADSEVRNKARNKARNDLEDDAYLLLGVVDLTQGKAIDDTSWGKVMALYRTQ